MGSELSGPLDDQPAGHWPGRSDLARYKKKPSDFVVFTVNDEFWMLLYAYKGFDAIGTDKPRIFLSALRLLGLSVDDIAAWLSVSFANLSYLIPSSPGAIGPFELAVKSSLAGHGAAQSQAALFGLALHAWLLLSVTGAGGLIFLIHRARIHNHTPLLAEIDSLPEQMP